MSNMNRLDATRRALVVKTLVEGNGLRATARITGVARMTVEKLLRELGPACEKYQDETLRNLNSKRVQCDEIWAFCYAKERAIKKDPTVLDRNPEAGDVWTWTAIDADSKLCISWLVGTRSLRSARTFIHDVASRLANRVQLTTDAYRMYLNVIEEAFGMEVDYAQLNKIYTSDTGGRYSPPICIGCEKREITGSPDPKHISTSYVERQNLTMRMHMRRFTRLTNAHSKKLEMHRASVALHFMYYNFVRLHESLRVPPAMAAGVTDKMWDVADILALLNQVRTR